MAGLKRNPLLPFFFISLSFSCLLPSILAARHQSLHKQQLQARRQQQESSSLPCVLMKSLVRDQNGNILGEEATSTSECGEMPISPTAKRQRLGVESVNSIGEAGKVVVGAGRFKNAQGGGGGLARQFLDSHNEARAKLGLPPLIWDRGVTQYARRYASQRKADCNMIHSNGGPYGENIFWGGGGGWKPSDVVNLWVGEQKNYDPQNNSCAPGEICGHYTQVVWKNSQKLGCSRVVCDSGDVFMTCNYDPPGNYQGMSPFA